MVNKGEDRDKLAGILADSLNKKFKDFKVAYFLDGAGQNDTIIQNQYGDMIL